MQGNSTLPVYDQIDSIASGPQFVDSFAGDILGGDGVVTVYATSAGLQSIASALSAAGIPSSAYRLVSVAHSFADLEALTMKLAADETSLQSQGINLVTWGPDPSSNTVSVQLAGYTPDAAAALQSQYGGANWITVQPATGPTQWQLARNRYYDTRPFEGGDRIFANNSTKLPKCTSGFTLVGNNSGNYFTTEAAHCADDGLNPVWTNLAAPTDRGSILTNYLTNGDQFDVASFNCNCGPYVWYEGPSIGTGQGSTHTVVGWCDCNVGLVTFDGASTGEVPDASVDRYDYCSAGSNWSDGYTRCHLNEAKSTSTICQKGDSGGPVYQRAANNAVYATGSIVGYAYSGGYEYCSYERIHHILTLLNVSLLTG